MEVVVSLSRFFVLANVARWMEVLVVMAFVSVVPVRSYRSIEIR